MRSPTSPPVLLLVEANWDLRHILHQVLVDQGYAVMAAASLEQALRLVHRQPVDLILTDLFTSAGQESLAHLLPLQKLAHGIPIVVVATWLTASDVRQQGFSGVLHQPFGLDDLVTAVAEGLNQPFSAAQRPQTVVAQRFVSALLERDVEAVLALCTEEVRMYPWIVPAYPAAHPAFGWTAARAYLEELQQYFVTSQAESVQCYPCPHGVAVRLWLRWQDPAGVGQQQMVGLCLAVTAEGQISQVGLPVQDERLRSRLWRWLTDAAPTSGRPASGEAGADAFPPEWHQRWNRPHEACGDENRRQRMQEQDIHLTTTKTPGGWKIELDHATWVLLLEALNRAITLEVMEGHAEQQRAHQVQALRQALEHIDKTEGF